MLNFYLLGLAGSGTTAFCNVLNLHPSIYCGQERFAINLEPERIIFPDSYLNPSYSCSSNALDDIQNHLGNSSKSKTVKFIGDKHPQKFYYPKHLENVSSNIFLYRSYKNVCKSWDKRANNKNDLTWADNKSGIFLFIDLLIAIQVISSLKNVIIVNYDNLFFGDYKKELGRVCNQLGLSENEFPYDSFKDDFYSMQEKPTNAGFKKEYAHVAESLGLIQFENQLFNADYNKRIKVIQNYAQFINSNRNKLFATLVNSDAVEYYSGPLDLDNRLRYRR